MRTVDMKILLENLLNRVEIKDDGSSYLVGKLTEGELSALRAVLSMITDSDVQSSPEGTTSEDASRKSEDCSNGQSVETKRGDVDAEPGLNSGLLHCKAIKLNLSALSHSPPDEVSLCLDFGTAMSKATLVRQLEEYDPEEVEVLRLGVPGDQEEVSETMLISSVYIDNSGQLWLSGANSLSGVVAQELSGLMGTEEVAHDPDAVATGAEADEV